MAKSVFKGSGVALITPFNETGVDFQKLDELIEFQIQGGTDAIIITGTTGEASVMTDEEQIEVIRHTVETVNHRIPVIAGCGSNDTRHGAQLSAMAEQVGVDGLLSVTPYYNKTTQQGLVEHFSYIAKAVSVPIILYNVPGRTGLNMLPSTVVTLMERHAHIVGVKECNFEQVGELIQLGGPEIQVYSGEDGLAVPLMSLGGCGVISVLANVVPNMVAEMMHACLQGDYQKAGKMQVDALPLIHALFSETSPIPVKEAMNQMGMQVGMCRLPLVGMQEQGKAKLMQVLQSYGLV